MSSAANFTQNAKRQIHIICIYYIFSSDLLRFLNEL